MSYYYGFLKEKNKKEKIEEDSINSSEKIVTILTLKYI